VPDEDEPKICKYTGQLIVEKSPKLFGLALMNMILISIFITASVPTGSLGTTAAAEAPGYDKAVERWFTFACVWSLGAAVDEAGRRRFNDCLREIEPLFPPVGTVYDYAVDSASRDFKPWADRLSASWRPAKDAPFARIIGPTVDTVRNLFVMTTLMAKGTHVLLVGNTGAAIAAALGSPATLLKLRLPLPLSQARARPSLPRSSSRRSTQTSLRA
jgi:hypothetical protein